MAFLVLFSDELFEPSKFVMHVDPPFFVTSDGIMINTIQMLHHVRAREVAGSPNQKIYRIAVW
jgi:hypothetical protein